MAAGNPYQTDPVPDDSIKFALHMTLAAVDRLVHHSTIFASDIESYLRCTGVSVR